jgi:death-on-curing protein
VTRYLTLAEYLWLAEQVRLIEAATLVKASRTELADSALHAPGTSFDGDEFYVDLAEKAVVLVCRLARNHPLPDGNKRAAWASLVMFVDLNEAQWTPAPPDIDEAEAAMLAVAAHEVDEALLPLHSGSAGRVAAPLVAEG